MRRGVTRYKGEIYIRGEGFWPSAWGERSLYGDIEAVDVWLRPAWRELRGYRIRAVVSSTESGTRVDLGQKSWFEGGCFF